MTDLQNNDTRWKSIYSMGAIAAIIVLIGTFSDIIIGSILGGNLTALPQNAIERFIQFNRNPLLGLYNLDMLNVCTNIIMIPVFFAIFAAHRRVNILWAGFAMIVYIIGNTIFITNNAALPMYDLALKYSAAPDEVQRTLLAAAGEALLAKGAHGSFGVFWGFLFPVIANIIISVVMLTGKVFSKVNSYIGIFGSLFLLVYLILVTFVPGTQSIALIIAMPGGLLSLAWMIMVTIKLFQLSKNEFAK